MRPEQSHIGWHLQALYQPFELVFLPKNSCKVEYSLSMRISSLSLGMSVAPLFMGSLWDQTAFAWFKGGKVFSLSPMKRIENFWGLKKYGGNEFF